jgi:hypothetical protein
MNAWDNAQKEVWRHRPGRHPEYPKGMLQEPFTRWFPTAVQEDIRSGVGVIEDVKALINPPSREGRSYRSMYVYGNHIWVRSAEVNLNTYDSSVVATFSQSCRMSSSDRNLSTTHLEYIGWVEEIIAMDYGKFELYVLYCSWVQVNLVGAWATIKRDDYGFNRIKFNQVIPYSIDLFAFPMHVQHVFFVDEVDKPEWKVVLHKQPWGTRIASKSDDVLDLECLRMRRDGEH